MKTTLKNVAEPTESEIQHQAYLLWVEGGCRSGRELDDWLAARELLLHNAKRAAGAKASRGPKKSAVSVK